MADFGNSATSISDNTAAIDVSAADYDAAGKMINGIYCGAGGDINYSPRAAGAADVLLVGVPQGAWLPIRASIIRTANTTATNIVVSII